MKYAEILKKIAKENNTTVQEVEQEMLAALRLAGINASPEEFIKATADKIRDKC